MRGFLLITGRVMDPEKQMVYLGETDGLFGADR